MKIYSIGGQKMRDTKDGLGEMKFSQDLETKIRLQQDLRMKAILNSGDSLSMTLRKITLA